MRKMLLFMLILSAISCKREKYCWQCRSTTTLTSNVELSRSVDNEERCNMTVSEMQRYVESNSYWIKERQVINGVQVEATAAKTINCFQSGL